MKRLSRRNLLRGAGASLVLAPFLPVTEQAAAAAEDCKRLILLFSPNGTVLDQWRPSGGENDFDMTGTSLESLAPYQDRLLLIDGLEKQWGSRGSGHQKGIAALWTGAEILAGDQFGGSSGDVGWGGGISVDQVVANQIGDQTPYASLEFAVQPKGHTVRTRMIYKGPDQPVAAEDDPYAMFDRLFGDLDPEGTELERIRAEQRSVIDVVSAELEDLTAGYGAADQHKLEAHLDAIREIEKRLDLTTACDVPTIDGKLDIEDNAAFGPVGDLQMELLAAALRCDLTRVASLQWSKTQSQVRHTWLDIDIGHHDLSHESGSAARDDQALIDRWYAEKLKILMDLLDATPELGGEGTILDNTLIVWGNELAQGDQHSPRPQNFLLAGGAAGYFDMGRYLVYDEDPHNRLLVSIAHMMGVEQLESIGDLDPGSGPLAGLVG